MAVAAFGEWHLLNEPARAVLDGGVALPVHCLMETYSVLTGFPPPHRAAPGIVNEWLADRFPDLLPAPSPAEARELVGKLAAAGRSGGAVYDGLVGLTARVADLVLVSADRRATAVYDLVGARWEYLQVPPAAPDQR